ncbi:MAG: NAD-dependent epimerase/dehydratase family protein [Alphaproteobacteria bacterium]|jgi:UDP-glucose 4-epimerase|nr:NAD-dependent epimerase/dehydratase family protein [Alphaproteobacteria bacterium]
METVLVTGANGFIAGHLCRHFAQAGFEVRGSLRGGPDGLREGIHYRTSGEIDGDTDWRHLLAGVDVVIHTAAVHQPPRSHPDPFGVCRDVNVLGTERLARQAAAEGVDRFIYTSSIAAQQAEEAEAGDEMPRDLAYAASKLEAERRLADLSRSAGLGVVVLRLPAVYGPDSHGFGPLATLLRHGWPMPFAGAEARRSYIYVGNLISAVALCVDAPAAIGRVLPVADGPAISTAVLVRHLADALGRPARSFRCPRSLLLLAAHFAGRAVGVRRLLTDRWFDDTETRACLGWSPPYTMMEGLSATLAAPGSQ